MTKQQIEKVIELLDNVTLDINSVEIIVRGTDFETEGNDLWRQAYSYKKKLMNMLKSEAINEKLS